MRLIVSVILSLGLCAQAHALCTYKGQMYAKTTLAEEFSDSDWVVRVKVMAADEHWSDEDESWTLYHLEVMKVFKGNPSARIEMFTMRDSGGFYLDKGMSADLGGEYLLFLDRLSHLDNIPAAARAATEINYACGVSKAWSSVSRANLTDLARLSSRSR